MTHVLVTLALFTFSVSSLFIPSVFLYGPYIFTNIFSGNVATDGSVHAARHHRAPMQRQFRADRSRENFKDFAQSSRQKNNSLPYCGHSLVVTGPRHGSTWFVNNIENCSFSHPDGTFGTLHDQSELWIQRPYSKVANLSVERVEHYVAHNVSLKMFPYPWRTRQHDAKRLLLYCIKHNIPVILLQRDVRHAFQSMVIAKKTNRWNDNAKSSVNSNSNQTRIIVQSVNNMIASAHKEWTQFEKHMNLHHESVSAFLDLHNLPYDRVIYDHIVNKLHVELQNAQCRIRNCNYVNDN